ncbi:hypothetical protein [Aurantibacillus circumpalustris]|uniref:hypothetical protein n=1 Tax=Aurantibacillus circumpalustris TaxID=3036359 RepID=UPI00295A6D3C|nr:hypothetical protein [Aurantibacillus circumpalustris]
MLTINLYSPLNTSIIKFLLLSIFTTGFNHQLLAQKYKLDSTSPNEPIILKGKKAFNMNAFDTHMLMYVTKLNGEDSLSHVFTDSLRFLNDTILVRLCDMSEKGCSETLVPSNERSSFINKSYWQKIPLNRITKIKSKRQPIARISLTTVIVSYAVFVASAAVSVFSYNSSISQGAAVIAGASNTVFLLGWGTNVFVAKKRFKFNKIKTYNSYKVMM